jgi:aromatic-L-amino-acid/L-tryptophan decarboxylase
VTQPGAVATQLSDHAPGTGEEMRAIADFEHLILPGITHWQHPRFFAYSPPMRAVSRLEDDGKDES